MQRPCFVTSRGGRARGLCAFLVCFWLCRVLVATLGILVASCRTFHWRAGSLVAPRYLGSSSQTRNRTSVPCLARRILNYWITREDSVFFYKSTDPTQQASVFMQNFFMLHLPLLYFYLITIQRRLILYFLSYLFRQ